jgi:hypothetical protein
MADLHILKGCELHVHTGGCLAADDLLALGLDHYKTVDWTLFVESYAEAFGLQPDPHQLYREASNGDRRGIERFQQHYVFSEADGGDFGRFQAKFNFLVCLTRYWRHELQQPHVFGQRVLARHQQEGLDYVEYRAMFSDVEDMEGFLAFHGANGRLLQQADNGTFTPRYLVSLPRSAPLESYALLQHLFDEHPELIPIVVGIDFCAVEEGFPPATVRDFFAMLHADNANRPERALEVAYHVGESYFDKSLESAVRWCHEVAEMGARRLGHAIALGLDPAIAIDRRPQAHEVELVSERLAQIEYDLAYRERLAAYGVAVERAVLEQEREELGRMAENEVVERPYSPQRFHEIRRRQDFVLDQLAGLGTVIESCPTSNLRIGGVPDPKHHPIHRFLRSDVNLVISADDPGIFDSTLADEVDWVLQHTHYEPAQLVERLGDPRRFSFGQRRAI